MSRLRKFCSAIRIGNLNKVLRMLEKRSRLPFDINATEVWFEPGWRGSTLFAAKEYGSSVPSMYLGPMTPLAIASTYGHYAIVERLLQESDIKVNQRSGRQKDFTPLDCCIKWRNRKTTEMDKIKVILKQHGGKKNKMRETGTILNLFENAGEYLLKPVESPEAALDAARKTILTINTGLMVKKWFS